MWVMVDGETTQVVATPGAREGVFVEVSDGSAWWAVKQERNAKGEIVTRSVELTEELRRIVENAQEFDREWPEGEKRPVVVRGVVENVTMCISEEDQPATRPIRAKVGANKPDTFAVDGGDRLTQLQNIRDRVDTDPTDPQSISKASALALLDCAIMAERAASFLEDRRVDDLAALEASVARKETASRQLEVDNLRVALAEHETKLAKAHGRTRIHSMEHPPEEGVFLVWQKWPAETPLAGVAPTLRTFAGGSWSARSGADAGWSFVPKGVL